jgi:hypothetical protein
MFIFYKMFKLKLCLAVLEPFISSVFQKNDNIFIENSRHKTLVCVTVGTTQYASLFI